MTKKIGPITVRFHILVLFASFLLSGCYIMKQGSYLLRYQNQAVDNDAVLERKEVDREVRDLLRETKEIKQFATEELGLKKDNNYTKYIEIEQDFLVYVVSASKKDHFEPYLWTFPFFGSFPYKGFYEKKDAVREAEQLKEKGYDVIVRKVDAFSTLGFFVDPLYTFMKDYSVYALANLIIHEQTHTTIFLKNQVQFNEEAATFAGNEGALAYLRQRNGEDSKSYRETLDYLEDSKNFYNLITILYRELDFFYEQAEREGSSEEVIARSKNRIVADFVTELREQYNLYFETEKFRKAIEIPPNNAYVLSYVRYTEDLSLFYSLLRAYDNDLFRTIEAIRKTNKHKKDPKQYLRSLIEEVPAQTVPAGAS